MFKLSYILKKGVRTVVKVTIKKNKTEVNKHVLPVEVKLSVNVQVGFTINILFC